MASISRCKSASVRAAPLTRATTFAVGFVCVVACVDTVLAAIEGAGACAGAARAASMRKTEIKVGRIIVRLDCISCDLFVPLPVQISEEHGEGLLPPRILLELRKSHS